MNTAKILSVFSMAALATHFANAVPVVSSVEMSQSSGKRVTITYSLSEAAVVTLEVQTNANTSASQDDPGWTSIGGPAVCNAQGDVWKKVAAGAHTITWNPRDTWPDHEIAAGGARAKVTAWALDNTPDYMVVDISAGAQPNTQKYYPSVDFLPGGILGNSDYRTSKLVMRKIMAKNVEWTMGSTALETLSREAAREATHLVMLTNNYYVGVFEITQSQWNLLPTENPTPSYFNNAEYRAMRPVEKVCYNEIRNSNNTIAQTEYDWPNAPHPNSYLGLLRARTGIDFDLPSEAQWEFAARAGNGDTKWGNGSGIGNGEFDGNLDNLGRYNKNGGLINGTSEPAANCDTGNGTAIVGTYAPNSWGIYDMHGNVCEWCLDWSANDISALGGKVNTTAGTYRIWRGGCWSYGAGTARAAYRSWAMPDYRGRYQQYGFRVVCTAGLD